MYNWSKIYLFRRHKKVIKNNVFNRNKHRIINFNIFWFFITDVLTFCIMVLLKRYCRDHFNRYWKRLMYYTFSLKKTTTHYKSKSLKALLYITHSYEIIPSQTLSLSHFPQTMMEIRNYFLSVSKLH